MASDNPRWGYTRIQGALANLGYTVGRNTIKRVFAENGIDPAGRRPTSWKTFLKAHWGEIAATDFFTVEAITWRGLVRYFVLFVIDLKTRRIEIAGIAASPDGAWMRQIARNWTDRVAIAKVAAAHIAGGFCSSPGRGRKPESDPTLRLPFRDEREQRSRKREQNQRGRILMTDSSDEY
jgi:transposase InsO family protein